MRLKKSEVIPHLTRTDPELFVSHFIATRRGDAERGPAVWLNPADARIRVITEGELVWVRGPRGQQLATAYVDEGIKPYSCIVRDLVGVSVTENIRIHKPDLDNEPRELA